MELQVKEFMFNFEGGGWNTVYAKTKRGAITKALKEYKDSDTLNPIASTFKRADKNLCSLVLLTNLQNIIWA